MAANSWRGNWARAGGEGRRTPRYLSIRSDFRPSHGGAGERVCVTSRPFAGMGGKGRPVLPTGPGGPMASSDLRLCSPWARAGCMRPMVGAGQVLA
jgi:hypothetical protein